MFTVWTPTAIELLNDHKFLLKRILEQRLYILDLKTKFEYRHKLKLDQYIIVVSRYFDLLESAKYQLKIFEKQLNLLKP